jgi:Bacteriophage HK97-gp10, putative tail-component
MAKWDARVSYIGTLWSSPVVTAEVRASMKDMESYALNKVQERTPVDTGKMKGSWSVKTSDRVIEIRNPVKYAGFIEFGTRKIPAFNCVSGAMPDIEAEFVRNLGKRLDDKYGSKGHTGVKKTARLLADARKGVMFAKSRMYKVVEP